MKTIALSPIAHVVLCKRKNMDTNNLNVYMKFVSEIDAMGYGHLCSEQIKTLDQPKKHMFAKSELLSDSHVNPTLYKEMTEACRKHMFVRGYDHKT
jgi:hypothetical protein